MKKNKPSQSKIHQWMQWGTERVNRLSLRERLLVISVAIAVVFVVWNMAVMGSLVSAREETEKAITAEHMQITSLKNEYSILLQQVEKSPIKVLDQRVLLLEKENQDLQKQLQSMAARLISPSDMVTMLTRILESNEGLKVTQVENIPEVPVVPPKKTGGESTAKVNEVQASDAINLDLQEQNLAKPAEKHLEVFKHGLVLEFEGSYFATMAFLKVLEDLPWKMLWDTLTYEVSEYPNAKVKLTVYTLSLQKGWIGADSIH